MRATSSTAAAGPVRGTMGARPGARRRVPRIAASVLSADCTRLAEDVTAAVRAGADWVHLDVMDSHDLSNVATGPLVCEALRTLFATPLEVHLMVGPVDAFVPAFARAGADLFTFHPEESEDVRRTVALARAHGCRVGLALNPSTPLSLLLPVLDDLDLVMVTWVSPGLDGERFAPSALRKLRAVRELVDGCGHDVALSVDGGVDAGNAAELVEAGADTLVAGGALFGAEDYAAAVAALKGTRRRGPRRISGAAA